MSELILISLFNTILKTKVDPTCDQESIFGIFICAQKQTTDIAKGGLVS